MRKFAVLVLLLPALALAIYDVKLDTLGNWKCYFSNYGPWGTDFAGQPGGFWHDTAYVFGAGFWCGAIVAPDTLVTVGYNPNSGASELVPMLTDMAWTFCSVPWDRSTIQFVAFRTAEPPPPSMSS